MGFGGKFLAVCDGLFRKVFDAYNCLNVVNVSIASFVRTVQISWDRACFFADCFFLCELLVSLRVACFVPDYLFHSGLLVSFRITCFIPDYLFHSGFLREDQGPGTVCCKLMLLCKQL